MRGFIRFWIILDIDETMTKKYIVKCEKDKCAGIKEQKEVVVLKKIA